MPEAAFGTIQERDPAPITAIFIAVLMILTGIEYSLGVLRRFVERRNQAELLDKLLHELTILGFISFLLFLIQEGLVGDPGVLESEYFVSFDLAHIIILFIAFSFIFQAVFLVQYANKEGLEFLRIVRTPESKLLEKYDEMTAAQEAHHKKHGPNHRHIHMNSLQKASENRRFWRQVELKILEEVFLATHKETIPSHFDFGSYVGKLFHKYISEVGEVSSSSWFALAIVAVANYIRTLVDSGAETHECDKYGEADVFENGNGDHCYHFYFSYAFLCACVLNFVAISIYVASAYYTHVLLREGIIKVFKQDIEHKPNVFIITWNSIMEDFGLQEKMPSHPVYINCLKLLYADSDTYKKKKQDQQHLSQSQTHDVEHLSEQLQKEDEEELHKKELERGRKVPLYKKMRDAVHNLPETSAATVIAVKERLSSSNLFAHKNNNNNEEKNKDELSENLKSIFLFGEPEWYFFSVEFVFLLQSFYLSMYFTQFLPLAAKTDNGGWAAGLGILCVTGFFILRQVLVKSVLLHTTTKLNKEVIGSVLEETKQSKTIGEKVRKLILKPFEGTDTTEQAKIQYLRNEFNKIDDDNSGSIDQLEFRQFLGNIDVFLSRERFKVFWKIVDEDLSGLISFDEILIFVFPAMKLLLRQELDSVFELRKAIRNALLQKGVALRDHEKEFGKMFKEFDVDNSGFLNRDEVVAMLQQFNIKNASSEKHIDHLMVTMDPNEDGGVSYAELCEVIFPKDSKKSSDGRTASVEAASRAGRNASTNSKRNSLFRIFSMNRNQSTETVSSPVAPKNSNNNNVSVNGEEQGISLHDLKTNSNPSGDDGDVETGGVALSNKALAPAPTAALPSVDVVENPLEHELHHHQIYNNNNNNNNNNNV